MLLLYILEFTSGFSHMPHVRDTVVLRGTCSRPFVSSELRTYVPWKQSRQRCSQPLGLRMETGREFLERQAGQLGVRGVAVDMTGNWNARDLDVYDNPTQRGLEGKTPGGYTAMLVIPTGVGAKIGGFAGDGLPVARVMSSMVDTLITHPNVVNGAMLYWPMPNMLYTEASS